MKFLSSLYSFYIQKIHKPNAIEKPTKPEKEAKFFKRSFFRFGQRSKKISSWETAHKQEDTYTSFPKIAAVSPRRPKSTLFEVIPVQTRSNNAAIARKKRIASEILEILEEKQIYDTFARLDEISEQNPKEEDDENEGFHADFDPVSPSYISSVEASPRQRPEKPGGFHNMTYEEFVEQKEASKRIAIEILDILEKYESKVKLLG